MIYSSDDIRHILYFRFTYQIIVSFNPEVIGPHDIKHYTFWNELNRFYGAVEVNTKLAHEHKATIEFEAGMYNNIQMKAIRDEYVKLPSIRFGWVMGKTAIQVFKIHPYCCSNISLFEL